MPFAVGTGLEREPDPAAGGPETAWRCDRATCRRFPKASRRVAAARPDVRARREDTAAGRSRARGRAPATGSGQRRFRTSTGTIVGRKLLHQRRGACDVIGGMLMRSAALRVLQSAHRAVGARRAHDRPSSATNRRTNEFLSAVGRLTAGDDRGAEAPPRRVAAFAGRPEARSNRVVYLAASWTIVTRSVDARRDGRGTRPALLVPARRRGRRAAHRVRQHRRTCCWRHARRRGRARWHVRAGVMRRQP